MWKYSVIVLSVLVGSAFSECLDTWTRFGDSCYHFGHTDSTFADASRYCIHYGAHLVNIETKTENNFIESYLADLKDANHWIGMTDELIENVWKHYPSEATAQFLDFGPGQPDQHKTANCVAIWAAYRYHWVDEPCTHRYKPLCEMPVDREIPVITG